MNDRNEGPYRLVLGSKSAANIAWHCKHYVERGQMIKYDHGKDLAKAIGVDVKVLEETFADYMRAAKGEKKDDFNKTKFINAEYKVDDYFHAIVITPLIHYCMGGIKIDEHSQIIDTKNKPIPGLYATGEVCGGVHGINRLGGCSLLDCVVYGRVSGKKACSYLLE
jgi:succinate dehydrogenase/fumarate reductase flavoprotein subunit